MFFDGWYPLFRVFVVSICAYIALIMILRVSGKRTLSKMNAFDLIVTVALGSTLAAVMLNKQVALLEGILAFAMLAGLQVVISYISVRNPKFEDLIKSEPTLLLYRGEYLRDVMKKQRITETEVLAALRNQGAASLDVEAVVLETNGTITVVKKPQDVSDVDSLSDVNPPHPESRLSGAE